MVAIDKETMVLVVIPSLKKYPTHNAYIIIPTPKPINRVGHNNPSIPATVYFVPQI